MSELATLARPYAEAIADLAKANKQFDQWSDDLVFLTTVVESPELSPWVRSPSLGGDTLVRLILDVCANRVSSAAQNLVRVLVDYQRLALLPHVAVQYEALKAQHQGYAKVEIVSAYPLTPEQQQDLEARLQKSLGKTIDIRMTTDSSLIGGCLVRAGDQVTDLSVKGRLQQLAAELRH